MTSRNSPLAQIPLEKDDPRSRSKDTFPLFILRLDHHFCSDFTSHKKRIARMIWHQREAGRQVGWVTNQPTDRPANQLTNSLSSSPSSLIPWQFDIATIVFLFVLNRSNAVHSRVVLKLDPLTGRGYMVLLLLEDALARAGVGVSIQWRLKHRGVITARGNRTDRWRRNGSSWHYASGSRRPQRERWARGNILSSRNAQRKLGLSSTSGVHFELVGEMIKTVFESWQKL